MSTVVGTRRGRLGESAARPDGVPKVRGQFAFSSDLFAEGMLWGHLVRSPHPAAAIRGIDVSGALRIPGVRAVLTADDVPGRKTYGLDYPDQPVFAWDVVRFMGEPVAAVAADHPETARRAAAAIVVDYAPSESPHRLRGGGRRRADSSARQRALPPEGPAAATPKRPEPSSSRVATRPACRTRRSWAPSPGSPSRAEDGGVDLYIATQWLHVDQEQIAACLALPLDTGQVAPGRRRWRLRCPRGHEHAGPDLPAGPEDRATGEDDLLPRGVVPRPRPPSSGDHVVPPPRTTATASSSRSRPA